MATLSVDVLTFPSLLFQVMSHALIHQPVSDGTCTSLDSLKYAAEMTFVDLACDFSEAGYSIVETMGKRDITVVAVQSGILRASFLKNTGNVIEAWHVLGAVVRDAQEIGLHANPAAQNESPSISAQWGQEMRRRIWFVLQNWDIHMAVVLGRPITTKTFAGNTHLPDDLARREGETRPRKRLCLDPPTPFSLIRIGYDVAYRYFPQIHDLENRGAQTEDYSTVQETHAAIVESMRRVPLWCRDEEPDIRFDEHPSCHWLTAVRQAMTSGIYFVLLSLHRPYIFSVAESRTQALKAALKILTTQRRLFHLSGPQQYISLDMVYPSFDAMVISLATVVLFPNENLDVLLELVRNVRWGIDVLSEIGEHNAMAQSAHDVVKKLLSWLEQSAGHAVQHLSHGSEGELLRFSTGIAGPDSVQTRPNEDMVVGHVDTRSLSTIYHYTRSSAPDHLDLPFETLWPPQPIHDLFYQDIHALDVQETCYDSELLTESVQFDGCHPDNSFWGFMDNFSES